MNKDFQQMRLFYIVVNSNIIILCIMYIALQTPMPNKDINTHNNNNNNNNT